MSRVGGYRNRRPLRSPSTREADGRRSSSTALTTAIAVGSDSLSEHLEGTQKNLLFGKLFQPTVELPILPTPADSEGFVSSTRGPAVQGEILPRFGIGAP